MSIVKNFSMLNWTSVSVLQSYIFECLLQGYMDEVNIVVI